MREKGRTSAVTSKHPESNPRRQAAQVRDGEDIECVLDRHAEFRDYLISLTLAPCFANFPEKKQTFSLRFLIFEAS